MNSVRKVNLLDGTNILTDTQDIALLRAKVGMSSRNRHRSRCSFIYDNIAFGVRLFGKTATRRDG